MSDNPEREAFYAELTEGWSDLGHGHKVNWAGWSPDRELNPQHADHPDVEHASLTVYHRTPAGESCMGAVVPDTCPEYARSPGPTWHLESLDPLTLSPSLLCHCGDHGFIRDGRWVPA